MSQRDRRADPDYGFNGFFDLRDPQSLLKKMRYDYDRMVASPLSTYAAFDFFVTANHIIDWIWPSSSSEQLKLERAAETIPRICEHLANDAKHFIVNRPHVAVAGIAHSLEGDPFWEETVDSEISGSEPGLFIKLGPEEARELGLDSIAATQLALLVLAYWSRRMGIGADGR